MPFTAPNWPRLPRPIRNRPKRQARLRAFGVQFFFGAILGAALGLAFWAIFFSAEKSAAVCLRCLGGGALLGGLAAGIVQDEFWTKLGKRPDS